MKEYSIDQIKSIINCFEEKDIECIKTLSTNASIISDGVTKYTVNSLGLKHFIVFESQNSRTEVCFLFDACTLRYSKVKEVFGSFHINYNFRENYSEFKIALHSKNVADIFFIKDNKYEKIEDNKLIEIDPQGRRKEHSKLILEGFCLRLNG